MLPVSEFFLNQSQEPSPVHVEVSPSAQGEASPDAAAWQHKYLT